MSVTDTAIFQAIQRLIEDPEAAAEMHFPENSSDPVTWVAEVAYEEFIPGTDENQNPIKFKEVKQAAAARRREINDICEVAARALYPEDF